MDEQFRIIEGYPGYRVDREGQIESRWGRTRYWTLTDTWHPLKPIRHGRYLIVNLSDGTRKVSHLVHRVVLTAFVGPAPPGLVCCHNDGNPVNNRIENLRWDTYQANEDDKLRHGTKRMGEQINAKLTESEVREIRRLASQGIVYKDLAATYGVTRQNIQAIIHRRTWRHVP
jgi:hypothetical protein